MGRPFDDLNKVVRLQKLRKKDPKKYTFRYIKDNDPVLKGIDLHTLSRWRKVDVGAIVDN